MRLEVAPHIGQNRQHKLYTNSAVQQIFFCYKNNKFCIKFATRFDKI
jgi:hypothetical protein